MSTTLYPLKFDPILAERIWGGKILSQKYNKKEIDGNLGESWELSGQEKADSVVINGFLSENTLSELIETYMGELVGDKIYDQYGLDFPLLFKLIDANDKLSIQVHPNDEVAAERHQCFGKTEMWYVVEAEPGAELIIGFAKDSDRDAYLDALDDERVEELLDRVPVKAGDVFFIPAGLVHAIGKGVVIAEIQQSSDITYRIYDYNRKDANGNGRELHTEQALDVINFNTYKESKIQYDEKLNEVITLVDCEYFTTNLLHFNQSFQRDYAGLDSFKVLMCLDGSFTLETEDNITDVEKGETILIPAVIDQIHMHPTDNAKILEVFVQ